MKHSIIAAIAAGAISLAALTGCQSSYSQVLGNASIELNELDGTTEGDFELPYTSVKMSVELESGTIDVEVLDGIVTGTDDDSDVVPGAPIWDGQGLAAGDEATFTDDDGTIIVRVTSHDKAKGKITFAEN